MYEYRCTITNVVDGDIIDAVVDLGFHLTAKLRLRLLGINSPEMYGAEKAEGRAAKEYVSSKVLGKEVVISTQKSDVFGRWLAVVYIDDDGNTLNELMITAEHATKWKR